MAIGRKTKRTPEVEQRIFDALRTGNTRKDASHYGGISQETFLQWFHRFPEFAESVTRAESDAAIRNVAMLQKAATGYDKTETKTVQKIAFREREILHPDGRRETIKEPYPYTETTTTVSKEFDWRAAESWLKRRRRDEWGDSLAFGKMSDEQLISYITGSIDAGASRGAGGSGEEGPASTG